MYLVGFVSLGSLGMAMQAGNNGLMKMEKSNRNKIEMMKKVNDEVYLINRFTQQMCEMSNGKLYEYVVKNGKRV